MLRRVEFYEGGVLDFVGNWVLEWLMCCLSSSGFIKPKWYKNGQGVVNVQKPVTAGGQRKTGGSYF